MTRDDVLAFLRTQKLGVVSSVNAGGQPQSAVVGYAVSDDFELVFDTLGNTRKAQNLRERPNISFTMWSGERTVQLDGVADEPQGAELARLKTVYFSVYPDGREREAWPGMTWFRVKPTWIRYTDFEAGPLVVEL
jgi:nitroimidazol reductase NimA-like FMN-containing flavoprotein (pyridoxamine 5'-phosphate oxidase superfamily)